jgi:hypothetical protein
MADALLDREVEGGDAMTLKLSRYLSAAFALAALMSGSALARDGSFDRTGGPQVTQARTATPHVAMARTPKPDDGSAGDGCSRKDCCMRKATSSKEYLRH